MKKLIISLLVLALVSCRKDSDPMRTVSTVNTYSTPVTVKADGATVNPPATLETNTQMDIYFQFSYDSLNVFVEPVQFQVQVEGHTILAVNHYIGEQGPAPEHVTVYVR